MLRIKKIQTSLVTTTSPGQPGPLQLRNGRTLGRSKDIFVSPSGKLSWIQSVHNIRRPYDALTAPGTGLFTAALGPREAVALNGDARGQEAGI